MTPGPHAAAALSPKETVRRDARQRRQRFVAGLEAAQRQRLEAAIASRIADQLCKAAVVASYAPMGHEVDPAACEAMANMATIALPWFESRDAPMQFRLKGGDLSPGPFGTLQPPATAEPVRPDLLLVPLVGFDADGHRVGQGKGHFDRALASLRVKGRPLAIGLAWDVQLCDKLPADSWDQQLDMVATPEKLYALC